MENAGPLPVKKRRLQSLTLANPGTSSTPAVMVYTPSPYINQDPIHYPMLAQPQRVCKAEARESNASDWETRWNGGYLEWVMNCGMVSTSFRTFLHYWTHFIIRPSVSLALQMRYARIHL